MTTRDPEYINPDIKTKLRGKNKLMRAGRVEEAGAMALRIGKDLTRHARTSLSNVGAEKNANDMWAAVRKSTGRQQESSVADGISAESLNDHYAAISTDHSYSTPSLQPIVNSVKPEYITEWHVF